MSKKTDLDAADSRAVTRMMFKTLFSTTARIFLPVTLLFLVGLAIDLNIATKPWGMAIGTTIGIIIAAILVIIQLKSIRQQPVIPQARKTKESK